MTAMNTLTSTATLTIEDKTTELCQNILDQSFFPELHKKVELFLNDEALKYQFQMLNDRSSHLQQKQSLGAELKPAEIAEFEGMRAAFLQNPTAKNFLEAQEQIQKIQDQIHTSLAKTFELGRLPKSEDFDSSCGSGCGCH